MKSHKKTFPVLYRLEGNHHTAANATISGRRIPSEEHIKLSLRSTLLTRKGERPLHPHLGTSLHTFLFRPLSSALRSEMAQILSRELATQEPRIDKIAVEITADATDHSCVNICVGFRNKETQRQDTLSLRIRP